MGQDYNFFKEQLQSYVRQLAHQHPTLLQIIYECPCKIERKEYHHFDYFRAYEVIKLCARCHGLEHRRLNKKAENDD